MTQKIDKYLKNQQKQSNESKFENDSHSKQTNICIRNGAHHRVFDKTKRKCNAIASSYKYINCAHDFYGLSVLIELFEQANWARP